MKIIDNKDKDNLRKKASDFSDAFFLQIQYGKIKKSK